MRTILLLAAVGAVLATGCLASADEVVNVKLTVTERAGFERVDEPVTFGVPLPAGAVVDPQTLCLLDEQGNAIPASFREAQRWVEQPGRPGTGSLRWVHVSCLLSLPAKATRTITLTNTPPVGTRVPDADPDPGPPRPTAPVMAGTGDMLNSPLKVTSDAKAAKATVVTGPVKLALDAGRPGVIEAAWFDPAGKFGEGTQVLRGSDVSGVTVGGKMLTEIDPATAQVEVLEAGPMRAVVLLRGKFKDSNSAGAVATMPDRDLKAEAGKTAGPGLIYEARVIAYAGSPRVAIDYTIINKIGTVAAHKIDLGQLRLGYGHDLANPRITIGNFDAKPIVMAPGENLVARVQQIDADRGVILHGQEGPLGDPIVVEAKNVREAKPAALGWLGVSGDRAGAAMGVASFWQMYPKGIQVTSKPQVSTFELNLFTPTATQKVQELFIGQARTHRITLFLHDGQAKPEALNAVFAAANAPLMPLASPDWYCQKTQCWGPLTSADAGYGDFAAVEGRYNQVLSDSMDQIVRNVEVGLTDKGVTQDGYGWMNWGDSFFRVPDPGWGPVFPEPHKNLSWNGNYYDYGMAMLFQFMRTGDVRFLDHGLRAAAYTADVFVNHWGPDPARIGACHYCPPRYHAATDDGVPYVSEQFNHAKIASVVARWQLLGDWWARQVMFETFNHAEAMTGSETAAWRQCRGNGHRLHILWCAYQFTGEQKYVNRAGKLLALGVDFIKKNTEFDKRPQQRFMVGVALEGMIQQYWIKPDPAVLETIKFVADYAVKDQDLKGYTANLAFALGFLWQQTGDVGYLRSMRRMLNATGPSKHAKYFGQTFRSTPYALGYLHEAAAKGVKLPPAPTTAPTTTDELMMIK